MRAIGHGEFLDADGSAVTLHERAFPDAEHDTAFVAHRTLPAGIPYCRASSSIWVSLNYSSREATEAIPVVVKDR